MYVGGASNVKVNDVGIVLEGPRNILIEQALKYEFTANNNQVEYGASIVDMVLALEMGSSKLNAKRDSQLVTDKVSEQYQAKESQLIKYTQKVRSISSHYFF